MNKTQEFLTGLKGFFTEDKYKNAQPSKLYPEDPNPSRFSFDDVWYKFEEKNRDQKTIDEARSFVYLARQELDGPIVGGNRKGYSLYNHRVAEYYGYVGLIGLVDRAIELIDLVATAETRFKQLVSERKKKKQDGFTIEYKTLDKWNLNNYAGQIYLGELAGTNALKLKIVDDGWLFEEEKD